MHAHDHNASSSIKHLLHCPHWSGLRRRDAPSDASMLASASERLRLTEGVPYQCTLFNLFSLGAWRFTVLVLASGPVIESSCAMYAGDPGGLLFDINFEMMLASAILRLILADRKPVAPCGSITVGGFTSWRDTALSLKGFSWDFESVREWGPCRSKSWLPLPIMPETKNVA